MRKQKTLLENADFRASLLTELFQVKKKKKKNTNKNQTKTQKSKNNYSLNIS